MKLYGTTLMKKLIRVIESMTNPAHVVGTRNYINFYYRQYGIKNKPIIEMYYNVKVKKLRD